MKRKLLCVFILAACFFGLVIPANAGPASDSANDTATPPRLLTMGMVLYTDASSQQATIEPLAEYLGKSLGMDIQIRLFHDYYDILNDIDHESLELALLSPTIYSLILDDPALTFVAVPLERDQEFYHSVILTNKDSSISGISDLTGRKLGFVNTYSASGYLVPAEFLTTEGLSASGSSRYDPVFLGSHGKAVRALLEKKVDAVCTYDTFFDFTNHQLGEYKNLTLDSFKLLKQLPEKIPADALVCRTALGKDIIARLQQALRDYRKEREAPGSPLQKVIYTGFQTQPCEGYQSLRKRLDSLMGNSPVKERK
ncbi:MAG: phosphate/phosphite/phosphonate ABC transporter substrate-binding protein [Candidatus Riflebacteria bacterium]|nr:phosphate/phosphite/phosphonate ABC transporter substrate-binding protein [Candidatus Riflebacteria bacterium]